jgi:hypothetical protein
MITMVSRICGVALLIALTIYPATRASAQGDPAARFSPAANPNGVWTYGFEFFPLPAPFSLVTAPATLPTAPGPSVDVWWSPTFGQVDVLHNETPVVQSFVTGNDNALIEPGGLGIHLGPNVWQLSRPDGFLT